MTTQITTQVGRLVGGHPMIGHPVIDEVTKQPKMQKDGVTPLISFYVGIAIAKGTETDWKQTEWGQKIVAEGQAGWPNGEYNSPTFAWKVTDGDSAIPNKKGHKPCDKEGYPGHWIINASNGFPIKTYNRGQYEAHQVIQRKEAIKRGDYIRLGFDVVANNPAVSPGVYINPFMVELYQAGIEILGAERDANEVFGQDAGALPPGAMIDTNVQQPQVPAPGATGLPQPTPGVQQPAPEILTPPPAANRLYNGQVVSEDQLRTSGWNDQQIATLPVA